MTQKRKIQTINLSIRTKKKVKKELIEIAQKHNVSLNSLVNEIFQDYIQIWNYTDILGSIIFARSTALKIISCCDEVELIEIARDSGSKLISGVLATMGIVPNLKNIIEFIEIAGTKANWFKFTKHMMNQQLVINLHHGISKKWSVYVANQTSAIFETLLNKKVECELFDGAVNLKIKLTPVEINLIE